MMYNCFFNKSMLYLLDMKTHIDNCDFFENAYSA